MQLLQSVSLLSHITTKCLKKKNFFFFYLNMSLKILDATIMQFNIETIIIWKTTTDALINKHRLFA